MDKILEFVVVHSKTIGQVVFAICLSVIALYIFLGLGKEDQRTPDEEALKDIEDTLKKLLQATQNDGTVVQATKQIKDADAGKIATAAATPATAAAAAPAGASAPAAAVTPEAAALAAAAAVDADTMLKIKSENEQRAKKIQELETQLKTAQDEMVKKGGASDPADKKKIEELEKKLGEYAIIEDDIANLNLYKEENVRLKTELDRMKSAGPADATAVAPAPTAASAPAPVAAPPTPAPAPAPAAAVASAAEPTPAPAPVAAATPPPAATPTPAPAVAEATPAADASTPVAKIDSEKLLAEFDALVAAGNDPAPIAKKEGEPKETGEALINEFENFMKSSNQ